jgi:Na+:H+ antiporter, NhaA family
MANLGQKLRGAVSYDSAGGLLLVAMTAVALVLANSPLAPLYRALLDTPVEIRFGELGIAKPLLLWVNDGLMALFFFLIGLEVKREVLAGQLSRPEQVVLPLIAAAGGVAVPAIIYFALNQGDPVAVRGWAIPSATDIAFAVAVFGLFATRLPRSLRLFLLSVAIFDDLAAIVIIALFYTEELSTTSLGIAGAGLLGLLVLNRSGVRHQAAYILLGVLVWVSVLKSGVHATLAGFAVAWFIPLHRENQDGHPMLAYLEHRLHPWVAFAILPLFAFANAGLSFAGLTLADLVQPVPLGIALGLLVGKQLGIFGVSALAIRLGLAQRPAGATWLQFYAVSILCGIGFTMSLFIGSLAFEHAAPAYLEQVKLGVLLGSLASVVLAAGILQFASGRVAGASGGELRVPTHQHGTAAGSIGG